MSRADSETLRLRLGQTKAEDLKQGDGKQMHHTITEPIVKEAFVSDGGHWPLNHAWSLQAETILNNGSSINSISQSEPGCYAIPAPPPPPPPPLVKLPDVSISVAKTRRDSLPNGLFLGHSLAMGDPSNKGMVFNPKRAHDSPPSLACSRLMQKWSKATSHPSISCPSTATAFEAHTRVNPFRFVE